MAMTQSGSKIKVLQILTSLDFGGVEKYVTLLAKNLDRSLFDVSVAASRRSRRWDLIAGGDIGLHPIPHFQKSIRPWTDGLALLELLDLLKRERFDVVHTHMFKASMLGRMAATWRRVPAVLFTAHGFHFNTFATQPLKGVAYAVEWWTARYFSNMILTVSHTEREQAAREKVIAPEKLDTVYPGIEISVPQRRPDAQEAFRRHIEPDGLPVIVTVGRLARQKDPATLVRAARILKARGRDFRVVFAGDGPLRPAVEAEIRRHGLERQVRILGFCTDIDSLLGLADVFTLASLFEGQPISIMEAMLNDVPVIASAVNGVPEIVRHGQTGLLVPMSDPEALADAIEELLSDPEKGRRLAAGAKAHLASAYSVQGMVRKIEDIYLSLLGRSRA